MKKFFMEVCYEYDFGAPFDSGRTAVFETEAKNLQGAKNNCMKYMKRGIPNFDPELCSINETKIYKG